MAKPHTYADEMSALDSLTPQTHPARDAEHFRRIIAARHALAQAQDDLVTAVQAAREAGDSWTVIGAALGTTRQGAFRKFGHTGDAEGGAVVSLRQDEVRAPYKGTRAASRSALRSYGLAAKSPSRTAKLAVKATAAKGATKATPAKSTTKATPAKSASRTDEGKASESVRRPSARR